MKITCGTDIIEVDRIKDAIENGGEKFLHTVFTDKEIKYCESKKMQKYQSYAARFAAKEATFKALSEHIENAPHWTQFEIIKNEKGKPSIDIKCNIEELESIEISMSHCKEYASANSVAIFK